MKTTIFNIWTQPLKTLLKDICVTAELLAAVETWTDEEGGNQFQMGQGKLFQQEQWALYAQAIHPCAPELFDLAKQQIIAGFNAWFSALIEKFPSLNNHEVKEEFKRFSEECTSEKYYPFIASRSEITRQFVNRGNKKDIDFVIASFEFLELSCQASIRSMKDYIAKKSPAITIPRDASSSAFHRIAAPLQTEDTAAQTSFTTPK